MVTPNARPCVNTKRKGARAEHRSIRLLEAMGYRCTRAAASLGVWDIVGIGSSEVVLVQVKCRDWPGMAALDRMRRFPAPANVRKLVYRYRDGVGRPDVREVT